MRQFIASNTCKIISATNVIPVTMYTMQRGVFIYLFWGGVSFVRSVYGHSIHINLYINLSLFSTWLVSVLALPWGWFWPCLGRRLRSVLHDSRGSQGVLPRILQEIHPGNWLGQIHGPAVRDICWTEGVVQSRLMPRQS